MIEKLTWADWIFVAKTGLSVYVFVQLGYLAAKYCVFEYCSILYRLFQGAPMLDYGNIPYMMHTHMAVPAVIAKPPAKKPKAAALLSALDSFYSDLATLEPPAPTEEAAVEPVSVPSPPPAPEPAPVEGEAAREAEQPAKRKKAKKAAGQGLKKKKGVSSLVAKWQQVQQDVRRDYLGDAQDSDSQ